MEINSIQYVDNIEDYGNDLCIEDYREFDDVNIYLLNTNIDAFAESDYYNTGVNNILFVTGIENGSYKIIQTVKVVAMAKKNYAWKSIMAECFRNQEQEI